MRVCTFEGCRSKNKKHFARGLCHTCYGRLIQTGKVEYVRPQNPECSIEGCTKKYQGLGYCYKHYRALKLYGDPLASRRIYSYDGRSCRVDACDRPAWSRDLCRPHYDRMRTRGTLEPALRKSCSYPGCERKHYGRGLCRKHWETRQWIIKSTHVLHRRERLDAQPFVELIRQMRGSHLSKAQRLGIEPRQLYRLLTGETKTIQQADADRYCFALSLHPAMLWPEEWIAA